MPMVHLTTPKGMLTASRKAALAEQLTHVLLMIEGRVDNAGTRSIAWVLFDEVDPGDWAVGGHFDGTHVDAAGKILARVTTPEGALDEVRRGEVVAAVHAALCEVLELPAERVGRLTPWVILAEVPEGHWGAGGELVGLRRIAEHGGAHSHIMREVDHYLAGRALARKRMGLPV